MNNSVHLTPRRSLTPSQELIWTSQRLQPESPHQNMALITRFDAPIDPDRFLRAVDSVADRSDALRTTVREVDGVPHPGMAASTPSPCTVQRIDESLLDQWLQERIAQPIDIASAAYESVLLDHGSDRWSWFVNVHHIVIDAASSANFFNAVADEYHGVNTEIASYADVWTDMAGQTNTARFDKARDHWALSPEAAPTSMYRPDSGPTSAADRVSIDMQTGRQTQLDTLLSDRFKLISPDLSLLVALATGLSAYLARLGNESVTIGIPIHHRSTKAAKAVIGPLVEMFPLHVEVQGNDTFASLHSRVTRSVFELLRFALPGTSPRQSFDTVLNVHGATLGSFGSIPAHTTWIHPGHIDPHHRLRVQALDYDGSGTLDLGLDVNHRIADADHRRRAGEHFAAVLDAMVDDPDQNIHGVGLVGDGEKLLLEPLTRRSSGTPIDGVAPTVVAERLRANGVIPTLAHGRDSLTASEVDELIEQAATALRRAGFGRGDLVGVEMPIGVDAVVAIHGILRAGAAFVPIDPTYPDTRREHIRNDSACRLVITSLDDLGDLDATPEANAIEDTVDISPDDLAYVIYTSGSTGLPKGVPITHRGLSEYLGFAHGAYVNSAREGQEQLSMPLFTSLSFDLTITTLFLPFLSGGLMTVHPDGGLPALREIVDEGRSTLIKATPSHLELLVRMIDADHPLRTLIVGGEAFMTDLADRLLDVLGDDLAIFNEYGPTEAVVGCMEHLYDRQVDPGPEVPIGRPAPGVELHILDAFGLPVPLGVAGELMISRPGMTTGYLGRPDLNESKLVHVSSSGTSSLLYRTGDLVRMFDADRMVYLGRIDEQIKVGGIRLEPGEIEHVALQLPGVRRAVAGLWTPDPNQTVEHCVRCGLGSDVPEVTIDGDGVCSSCHHFDLVAPQAESWFKNEDDLAAALIDARNRSAGDYDVVHLISGGKDSTYALYKLVEMGARVFAITLDNGYIAEVAKANVRRAASALGVDHEFVTVEGMDEIFRDSLDRFSNVCNGCYKAIYTIALAKAEELGIGAIVTGLSRGQFFETRLVPGMFDSDRFDPAAIDEMVKEARHVYHATPDAVSENMDVAFLADETIFDRITFIDFYRYVDVELSELYRALDSSGTWQRPPDSGRSTNCLINAAGIFVHKIEQGHHNYAAPYSWDVRLGHKTRDEALFELDDPMDDEELTAITTMLAEVGYEPRKPEVLTLWIEGAPDLDLDTLRDTLVLGLPAHAVPHAIEVVGTIPLTANGKVDVSSLPAPAFRRVGVSPGEGRVPETPIEIQVASVWETVLSLSGVRATDDFFALGGTSLHALEMIVRVSDLLDLVIPESVAFTKRTVVDLAAYIDEAQIARAGSGSEPTSARAALTIPHLDDDDLPLSAGEEAMLYEWRRDPSDVRYNVARLYTLPADVDIERFTDAVRAVVAHQPTLHTSYGPRRNTLSIESALWIGEGRSEVATLTELANSINQTQFDLITGRLVTLHFLRSGHPSAQGAVGALIRTHHIVSDAGSLDVLWSQIDQAYRGEPLPSLDVSYAAHGAWQRLRTAEPEVVWSPIDDPGELLVRGSAPEVDGYVHRDAPITMSQLRSAPATTPFANALTALAATMAPYHDRSTFELTVTSSVRDHPDLANVVGYFLNPLPLLVDVDSGKTLASLADTVSAQLATALEHRAVPFGAVVRSARARGLTPPSGRVMLAVEDLATAELDGAPVDHTILSSGTAVNDLTFFVQIRNDVVELGVEYRGATVGRSVATRLLDEFADMLHALVGSSGEVVGALSLRPDPLRGPDLEPALTLAPQLIDAAAEASADRPAIRCGSAQLTYREMDDKSRALAARLRAVGVGPGDRVAVVLPRSVDLPVAVRASWILGASYVPIDVSQPASRVTELISAASVTAAVTAGDGHTGLTEVTTVNIDHGDAAVLPVTRTHATEPGDEAYVIFTSGSTGRPKGVPISHANLRASLAARRQWYDAPVSRYLLVSSAGFDSSVAGIFWTLADGGELVLPTEDEVHNVDALLTLIEESAPTHTLMVPSLYSALLSRHSGALPALRTVIVAGESCPPALVIQHHDLAPGVDLVNEYGPTEATVWATAHRCSLHDTLTVPIGRPIPGMTVEVVDPSGRSLPLDTAGELWVSGPGVANGYLGAEEASSFLPDRGTGPIYRTGDLVVRRGTGLVEFLGRVDSQLSVGGVRIEPAEIENTLTAIPGVSAAVVGLRGRDLLGWVESTLDLTDTELKATIATSLPETHVPKRIVVLPRLPRTQNGKVDRRAVDELPVETNPVRSDAISTDGTERLSDQSVEPIVAAVTTIFSSVFEGEPMTADTDFFDAGGDSLRAVALVSVLENEFGRRVAIGELIDAPTPRMLAARLDAAPVVVDGKPVATASERAAVARDRVVRAAGGLVEWLRSSGSQRPLIVLPPGGGNLLRYAPLVKTLDSDIPVVGIRLPGADARSEIVDSIAAQAATMLEALDSAIDHGPYRLLGWSTGGLLAWEIARLLQARGDDVEIVAMVDTVMAGLKVDDTGTIANKYVDMLRNEGVLTAVEEGASRVRERVTFALARRRYRSAREAGETPSLEDAERQLGPVIRRAALNYRPEYLDLPVVYFSASASDNAVTVDPWTGVQGTGRPLDVVTIEGVHFLPEDECIIGRDRVHELVVALQRRMRAGGGDATHNAAV